MTVWKRLWLAWVVLFVGGFFAIEIPAVLNDQSGDTLTENVVAHVPGEPLVAVFGALVVWLSVHFGTRYAKKRKPPAPGPDRVIPGTTLPGIPAEPLDHRSGVEDYDPHDKE